jgi:hypothetical protein
VIVSIPNGGRSKLLLAVHAGLNCGDTSRLIEAEREPVDRRSSLAGVVLPAVRAASPGDWWSCKRRHLSVGHSCLNGPHITGWTNPPLEHIERVDERHPFVVGRYDTTSSDSDGGARMLLREATVHRPVSNDSVPLLSVDGRCGCGGVMAATGGDQN